MYGGGTYMSTFGDAFRRAQEEGPSGPDPLQQPSTPVVVRPSWFARLRMSISSRIRRIGQRIGRYARITRVIYRRKFLVWARQQRRLARVFYRRGFLPWTRRSRRRLHIFYRYGRRRWGGRFDPKFVSELVVVLAMIMMAWWWTHDMENLLPRFDASVMSLISTLPWYYIGLGTIGVALIAFVIWALASSTRRAAAGRWIPTWGSFWKTVGSLAVIMLVVAGAYFVWAYYGDYWVMREAVIQPGHPVRIAVKPEYRLKAWPEDESRVVAQWTQSGSNLILQLSSDVEMKVEYKVYRCTFFTPCGVRPKITPTTRSTNESAPSSTDERALIS